jgi:hypothetical protein
MENWIRGERTTSFPGMAFSDGYQNWLQAELELVETTVELREKGDEFRLEAVVPASIRKTSTSR